MPFLSIHQLAEHTGKARENIKRKLHGVPFRQVGQAKCYDTTKVYEIIYLGGTGTDSESGGAMTPSMASMELNVAKRQQVNLQNEVLRKERIPLETITDINNEALSNIAGLLKANAGKPLSEELINDCFAEFRAIGDKIKKLGHVVTETGDVNPMDDPMF